MGPQEENRRDCYDDGYEDGKNSSSFNDDTDSACSEYGKAYENGFSAGCQSVEGNTNDGCKLTIEGHDVYCRDRSDNLNSYRPCITFLKIIFIKNITGLNL